MPKAEMVWVDLETTGLDYRNECIIEIGVRVTDRQGLLVGEKELLVISQASYERKILAKGMSPFAAKMHEETGLLDEINRVVSSYPTPLAAYRVHNESAVEEWILQWFAELGLEGQTYPLCGSTINFDRAFLFEHMPRLHEWFHYRNVDVSTLRNLCEMFNPRIEGAKPRVNQKNAHRPLADLDQSISDYLHYVNNFLFVAE